jgi:quercetin dioxygenase-like cupin family protein
MKLVDISSNIAFSKDMPVTKVIHGSRNVSARLLCLEAKQAIPPCIMQSEVLYLVMEGKGLMMAGKDKAKLAPGIFVAVPANVTRSIECLERLVILAIAVREG